MEADGDGDAAPPLLRLPASACAKLLKRRADLERMHGCTRLELDQLASAVGSTIGARVELCGLKNRPQLNGTLGRVVGAVDESTGRCAVQVDGSREPLALKPQNLSVAAADGEVAVGRPPAASPSAGQDSGVSSEEVVVTIGTSEMARRA